MPGLEESLIEPATRTKPPAWRRWAGVWLRSVHLLAVSWLAVALHSPGVGLQPAAATLLASGIALLAIELADRRLALHELAGALVVLKLLAVAVMAWRPSWASGIFWSFVLVSSLASHAPRRWRHWPTRLD